MGAIVAITSGFENEDAKEERGREEGNNALCYLLEISQCYILCLGLRYVWKLLRPSQKTQKKASDKIQHSFMKKTLSKLRREEIYFNIIKAMPGKPIINGKRQKAPLLRSGTKQGCLFSPLYSVQNQKF